MTEYFVELGYHLNKLEETSIFLFKFYSTHFDLNSKLFNSISAIGFQIANYIFY